MASHYPPCLLTLLTFSLGVFEGMKMVPLISNFLQQYAIPCAWFPALLVHTPLYLSSGVNLLKALVAPLILKLLTGWRSYLLRKMLAWYLVERKFDFCSLVLGTIDLLCLYDWYILLAGTSLLVVFYMICLSILLIQYNSITITIILMNNK